MKAFFLSQGFPENGNSLGEILLNSFSARAHHTAILHSSNIAA
jgi:hypothetical protein